MSMTAKEFRRSRHEDFWYIWVVDKFDTEVGSWKAWWMRDTRREAREIRDEAKKKYPKAQWRIRKYIRV